MKKQKSYTRDKKKIIHFLRIFSYRVSIFLNKNLQKIKTLINCLLLNFKAKYKHQKLNL